MKCAAAAAAACCVALLAVHLYKMCVLSDPPFSSRSLPFLPERVRAHRERALQALQTLYPVSVLPVQLFFLHGLCFPLFSRRGPSPKSRSPSVACLSEGCVPSVSSTVFVKALLSLSISTVFTDIFFPFLPPLTSSLLPPLYRLPFTPFTPNLPPSPLLSLYRPPLYPLFIALPYTPSLLPSPVLPLYLPPPSPPPPVAERAQAQNVHERRRPS